PQAFIVHAIGLNSHPSECMPPTLGRRSQASMRIVSVATEVLALAPRMFASHIWPMHAAPQMAEVASLVGDPARANILCALLDGRALTAGGAACFSRAVPPHTH